jgi:hypothetical protein
LKVKNSKYKYLFEELFCRLEQFENQQETDQVEEQQSSKVKCSNCGKISCGDALCEHHNLYKVKKDQEIVGVNPKVLEVVKEAKEEGKEYFRGIQELKKENQELKEIQRICDEENIALQKIIIDLQKGNQELKEENKQLKNSIAEYGQEIEEIKSNMCTICNRISSEELCISCNCFSNFQSKYSCKLEKQVKDLREQNEKQKDTIEQMGRANTERWKKIKELEEQLESALSNESNYQLELDSLAEKVSNTVIAAINSKNDPGCVTCGYKQGFGDLNTIPGTHYKYLNTTWKHKKKDITVKLLQAFNDCTGDELQHKAVYTHDGQLWCQDWLRFNDKYIELKAGE